MFGGKELVGEQNDNLKLFRVKQFSFSPAAALGIEQVEDSKKSLGSWNIDGELISQKEETLNFK